MSQSTKFLTAGPGAALAIVMAFGWAMNSAQPAAANDNDIDAATGRNIRYVTEDAMYLANEQWLLYACDLPAGQTDVGSNFNKDSYWYSRYNLGNLLFRSGMGIHLVHNALFKEHVKNDKKPDGTPMWKSPKEFMSFKIHQFCARTGVPCRLDLANRENPKAFPPKGAFPVFLEFAAGTPRFQQPPMLDDFTTLRWNPHSMDHRITPGALGQALLKQILWSEDFFANHREGKGPNGETLLGNDKEWGNGFRGAALTAESISKMFTLKSTLAFDPRTGQLGDLGDPAAYDPMQGLRFYPHAIQAKFMVKPGMPPAPVGWSVVDKSSQLFDIASLLWGTSEFYFYSDPTVKDPYDMLFGDQGDHKTNGALFPLKPHMLSKGLSVVNFKNMMAIHFDKDNGSFRSIGYASTKGTMLPAAVINVDEVKVRTGQDTLATANKGDTVIIFRRGQAGGWLGVWYRHANEWVKGWIEPTAASDITTPDAGLALVALANVHKRLHDAPPPLLAKVKMAVTAQARFLRDKLLAADGGFYNGYTFGIGADKSTRQLESQGLGIRGLLAAYAVTNDESFKQGAEKVYGFLNTNFWSDVAATYRSSEGARQSVYTPRNVGATLGALRELSLARTGDERQRVVSRIDKFFAATQTQHRQQLAEIDPTGEPIPSLDQIKAMRAQLAALMKKDPAKGKAMMMKMADVDSDGVPKPGMAGGKYGFAPVPASLVTVATQ